MRRFFILLMIALLPLRSWAGDVMAVSMSVQALMQASSDTVVRQVSGAMEDCAGHPDSVGEAPTAGAADDGNCKTCVTCQICHSVAVVSIDVLARGLPEVSRLKSTSASATLADTVKPPIS